ncbi:hypothetical protein GC194_04665 [bacterium]|nr:hypothetical protein [bacterium]
MKKYLTLVLLYFALAQVGLAQRKPMESSLLLGYQKYFGNALSNTGFLNLGYTAFFEHESMYHYTRRSRFAASALLNPFSNLYGLQIGGSFSYVIAAGFNANVIRQVPLVERTWQANLNPFVGLDFWFMSFHVGYNFQAELHPPLSPAPPAISRLNYTLNIYWPLKRNKKMYR